MDEKKAERLKSVPPSLKAAIRRARVEGAEQSEAVGELREAEIARLEILEEAIHPVLEQVPSEVDIFDAGIAYGERPRLFIDMIGFIEMAHDRRVYRFQQDTRHGRAIIADFPLSPLFRGERVGVRGPGWPHGRADPARWFTRGI